MCNTSYVFVYELPHIRMYACIALCICTHSIEYTYGETTLYIICSGTPNMLSVVEEGVSVIL